MKLFIELIHVLAELVNALIIAHDLFCDVIPLLF